MQRYATIEKNVGETPLQALARLRAALDLGEDVPLSYAGRLDPMASGTLLILIGEECKRQKRYHGLDKEYSFSILFGLSSDTGDVLGILETCTRKSITEAALRRVCRDLHGTIELPYPHFSSKTVRGKPLHIWALEERLDEIEIPVKRSTIYKLKFCGLEELTGDTVMQTALQNVESLPAVTESSKELGRDFRRSDIRKSWKNFGERCGSERYRIAHFSCTASSGTYMRSLSEEIARRLMTCGLALSIHRRSIGKYLPLGGGFGLWIKRY